MNQKTAADEAAALLGGSVLFGLAMSLFLSPCDIVMGGAGGIAVTLRHFIPLPVGVGIILINLPLLAAAVRMTGLRGMARTVIGVLATSVVTDLFAALPAATDDPLLAAVCGGAIMGAGGGLMLPRGYTTGGSDLAAYLITRRRTQWNTGTVILLIDAVIILGSALALGSFGTVVYSAASAAAYSIALDAVMSGVRRARLTLIISPRYAEIGDAITEKMNRGATVLRGMGWYTEEARPVVMCVIRRAELHRLKQLVRDADPSAFMIITDAAQVLGQGFEPPP